MELGPFLFELLENTNSVIRLINRYITIWPGGKPNADKYINMIGDMISGAIGWLMAHHLDKIGSMKGWYPGHL